MALILGNGCLNIRFYDCDPKKGTSLRGTACFGIFFVEIGAGALAVASYKNPQKLEKKLAK